jgi:hypothetical protein
MGTGTLVGLVVILAVLIGLYAMRRRSRLSREDRA